MEKYKFIIHASYEYETELPEDVSKDTIDIISYMVREIFVKNVLNCIELESVEKIEN